MPQAQWDVPLPQIITPPAAGASPRSFPCCRGLAPFPAPWLNKQANDLHLGALLPRNVTAMVALGRMLGYNAPAFSIRIHHDSR